MAARRALSIPRQFRKKNASSVAASDSVIGMCVKGGFPFARGGDGLARAGGSSRRDYPRPALRQRPAGEPGGAEHSHRKRAHGPRAVACAPHAHVSERTCITRHFGDSPVSAADHANFRIAEPEPSCNLGVSPHEAVDCILYLFNHLCFPGMPNAARREVCKTTSGAFPRAAKDLHREKGQ